MSMEDSKSVLERIREIPDPRINRRKRHPLTSIIVIALCAVMSGAEDCVSIAGYGRAKIRMLADWIDLPNGIPSHDTFNRVLARLDPAQLAGLLQLILNTIKATFPTPRDTQEIVSIDGKTLRGSLEFAEGKCGIHMVSAWANESQLVLGQTKVDDRSNEITAIPVLLKLLDLTGVIVTIDAIGCQKEIAAQIVEQQADYVLALKRNQPWVFDAANLLYAKVQAGETKAQTFETLDKGHARFETRAYAIIDVSDHFAWRDEVAAWPGLKSIGVVRSARTLRGKTSVHTRFYLTSLPATGRGAARRLGRAIRGHWAIENNLHWILDVSFREDECRLRKDNAPENLAVLRHIGLNLIKADKITKMGVKNRRLNAGWDDSYLLHLITI
jgi:predicted transposase YbfD/YdcC